MPPAGRHAKPRLTICIRIDSDNPSTQYAWIQTRIPAGGRPSSPARPHAVGPPAPSKLTQPGPPARGGTRPRYSAYASDPFGGGQRTGEMNPRP